MAFFNLFNRRLKDHPIYMIRVVFIILIVFSISVPIQIITKTGATAVDPAIDNVDDKK